MVLTIEEKREQKKIYHKKYRQDNKERILQKEKKYREDNREIIKERLKKYYQNNKEKESERHKKYREKNKEKVSEYNKKYKQTPIGIKSTTIQNWKQRGLEHEDISALYDQYINVTNCEECGIEFGMFGDGTGTFKCMDHCHETNLFRNFLCHNCNKKRG